jgi:hypothetical protein
MMSWSVVNTEVNTVGEPHWIDEAKTTICSEYLIPCAIAVSRLGG